MSQAQGNYVKPRLLAMVLTLCGVGLSLQGWTLALLGGSLYYLSAGLLLITVAVLLFRGKPEGAWLYGAFLGMTYLWALFEVGLDPTTTNAARWLVHCSGPVVPVTQSQTRFTAARA